MFKVIEEGLLIAGRTRFLSLAASLPEGPVVAFIATAGAPG